ncbi:MAG: outer membrane lipoprotein-sorting protein [Chitinispirillaceae bacterium]|nr:outer membrane lipoprotein-sorting protein [Chitinispirillaceae bacterium]
MIRPLARFLPVIVLAGSLFAQQAIDATELVRRADMKRRGKTSSGTMSITVERPGWKRTVSMKVWSLGTAYSLIVITAPAKEKGQAFLKRENEMWNYIPSIDRVIKLPPSMMGQAWMGSDFTNDDLLKESSLSGDYTHTLKGTETLDDIECFKVELLPKEEAAVVWGKMILWITKENDDIIRAERYDEDDELMSVEMADNIKKVDDRIIPTRMEMLPADKKGNRTVLEIGAMQFDRPIAESFFSQQNLKRVR